MNTWTIGAQVAVNFNTTEVPAFHSITEDGLEVARVNIYSHCGPQAKKRAVLIAGAPDMREALVKADRIRLLMDTISEGAARLQERSRITVESEMLTRKSMNEAREELNVALRAVRDVLEKTEGK